MSSQPCEVIKSKQGDFPKEMSELSQVTCKGSGLQGVVLKVNHSTLKKNTIEMEENALETIKTSPHCERFCLCLKSLSQLLLSQLFPILIHYFATTHQCTTTAQFITGHLLNHDNSILHSHAWFLKTLFESNELYFLFFPFGCLVCQTLNCCRTVLITFSNE